MISKRVNNMQESPIRKLVPFADEAKTKGIKVYHLNIGQPDIKTPDSVLNAIKNYSSDIIAYGYSQGEPFLRKAISDYFKKYDYVFFTGMSYQIDNGRKISSELQKMNIKTIAGGVHTTFSDESDYFDSIFIGEVENNCEKFIEDLKNSNLKSIYNEKNPPSKIVNSPIPLYELIKKDEIFPVQLTRGCPYDCNFCIVTKGFGKTLRIRPIKQIKKS